MERQILLPAPIRKEMDATFKLKHNDLSRALTYERNTPKARMLRTAAIERGGMIYTGAHAPNGYRPDVETRHDHAARTISQSFGVRVGLEVNKITNAATVFIDGERVATIKGMTLGSWGDVLYSLQQIYNDLIAI